MNSAEDGERYNTKNQKSPPSAGHAMLTCSEFRLPVKTRLVEESFRWVTIETKPAAILHQCLRRHHHPHHLHRPYRLRRRSLCRIAALLWASHFVAIDRSVDARRPAFCRGLPWSRLDH